MGGFLDPDQLNTVLLVIGGLIAAGGVLFWGVTAWRNRRPARRKEPPAPQPAPPSELPPGLVGALYGRADVRNILATVLDLGRRGHLTVQETAPGDRQGGGGRDYLYSLLDPQARYPFEREILDALFAGGRVARLSEVRRRLANHPRSLHQPMDEELARRGYIRTDSTIAALDRRYRRLAWGLWALAPVTLIAGLLLGMGGTVGLWAPPVGCVVAGLCVLGASDAVRRQTPRGAAEAARWFAFKQYLGNVPPRDLPEVGRHFDEYLPYALALVADALLIEQLRRGRVPVQVPGWYLPPPPAPVPTGAPSGAPRRKRRGKSDAAADAGTGAGGVELNGGGDANAGPDMPGSVEALNRGLVTSVESFNRSLAGMITTTSLVFTGVTLAGGGGGDHYSGGGAGSGDSGSFSGSSAGSGDSGSFSSNDSWSGGGDSDSGGGGGSSDVF